MKKTQFQVLFTAVGTLVALPFAWYIVYELPVRERVWWSAVLLAISFLIKKFVYDPIARRMPD